MAGSSMQCQGFPKKKAASNALARNVMIGEGRRHLHRVVGRLVFQLPRAPIFNVYPVHECTVRNRSHRVYVCTYSYVRMYVCAAS